MGRPRRCRRGRPAAAAGARPVHEDIRVKVWGCGAARAAATAGALLRPRAHALCSVHTISELGTKGLRAICAAAVLLRRRARSLCMTT